MLNKFGSIGSQKTSSIGFPTEYNCCGVKSIFANKFSPFSGKLKLPNLNSVKFPSADLNSYTMQINELNIVPILNQVNTFNSINKGLDHNILVKSNKTKRLVFFILIATLQ